MEGGREGGREKERERERDVSAYLRTYDTHALKRGSRKATLAFSLPLTAP